MDIHCVSTGEKPNPKLNLIGFRAPNPKTVGEKLSLNPNLDPKSTDIQPKIGPLPSLVMILI